MRIIDPGSTRVFQKIVEIQQKIEIQIQFMLHFLNVTVDWSSWEQFSPNFLNFVKHSELGFVKKYVYAKILSVHVTVIKYDFIINRCNKIKKVSYVQ